MNKPKKDSGRKSKSTYSQADFPVSLFPAWEKEQEKMMTVISGRRCYELLKMLDLPGLLAKTLLDSLQWRMAEHLKTYALHWKMKGTIYKRIIFQLAVSERGIEGTEYGLLLITPTASESYQDKDKFIKRMEKYNNGTTMPNLTTQINTLLPTPTARDYKDRKGTEWSLQHSKQHLGREIHHIEGIGKSLNPDWVEWLMGYPIGYTDIGEKSQEESQE